MVAQNPGRLDGQPFPPSTIRVICCLAWAIAHRFVLEMLGQGNLKMKQETRPVCCLARAVAHDVVSESPGLDNMQYM